MQKIEHDVYVIITELGAQAEVVIPPLELNDIRRERDEYLSQTASDLYDRVVYMVRSEGLEYDPVLDEGEGPAVELEVRMGMFSTSTVFWRETRRERQDRLKEVINEAFARVLNMQKNFDDLAREEEEEDEKAE
jgi:Asp-tRNA(Asn)/Glu-tRNA(Gln) amidotransferase A subunit family amidase